MGVCTFLVSDSTKEYFSLGKIFLSDEIIDFLKECPKSTHLHKWFHDMNGYYNQLSDSDIDQVSALVVTWINYHPDWKFITDQYEEFYDVYLATDEEDAKQYMEEFEDGAPVYKKTGSV